MNGDGCTSACGFCGRCTVDDGHGDGRPHDQFCRCHRCGTTFWLPKAYPEWTTRLCNSCHELAMQTQERKAAQKDVA